MLSPSCVKEPRWQIVWPRTWLVSIWVRIQIHSFWIQNSCTFFSYVLSLSVISNSLWPMDCSLPGSSVHGDSPGKNTGVGCHALLQEIFPTQGSNPSLLHCRQILYQLNCQGSPYFLIPPSICVSEIVDSVNRFKSSKKGNPCAISNRLEMKLLLHLWILESVNIAI